MYRVIVPGSRCVGNVGLGIVAQLPSLAARGDNLWVQPADSHRVPVVSVENPFRPGAAVLVTLSNPREKFWGAFLELTAQGLSLSGIELGSFDDLISMIKAGDPGSFGVVFFPMHRIERVELDLPDGNIPSLSQRFAEKTGLDPVTVLTRRLAPSSSPLGEVE